MKRLTKKIDNGRFVTTDAEARSYGETDPEDGFFYNYFTGEAVDKLAAYEDTGLEPAAIEELLAAVPKWISVEERLPDVAKKVLTYNGDFVSENWLCTVASKVGRINVWAYSDGFVTHWMPLPKAPKEVQDG